MSFPPVPAIDPSDDSTPEAPDCPLHFGFTNTYARLPDRFFARVNPTPVAAPRLIELNVELARFLNLDPDALATPEGIAILAGNRIAPGSEPLAQAYAGHQFGNFVPALGDGRANLLGELLGQDGHRYDLQLKGSGPTPFSRRGDGRAALGPVLREYLLSESMFSLGVPTTRALAAVITGESVIRESIQPGAIFTRVARSHLRIGTFQYFAARGDTEAVRSLANYAIERHYPEMSQLESAQSDREPNPSPDRVLRYRTLLDGVVARQASLVAQWLLLGFVHGVMNTDNTSISGETIDYGPCAFLEAYHPDTVFSSIDLNGRYSYSNQPAIMLWNLTRLAESLLPLLEEEAGSKDAGLESAKQALAAFEPQFHAAHLAGLRLKLGLFTEQEGDAALAYDLLDRMAANQADFTLSFRLLADSTVESTFVPVASPTAAAPERADPAAATYPHPPNAASTPTPHPADSAVRTLFADPTAFDAWAIDWRARLAQESASAPIRTASMRLANPAFIPRNHLVQAVIEAAVERDDLQPFHDLLAVVTHPYDSQPDEPHDSHRSERPRPNRTLYLTPARPDQRVTQTFCGT